MSLSDDPDVRVHGYRRDPRGCWRYTASGRQVPGARDVTLRRMWRFAEVPGGVAVPVETLLISRQLDFVRTYLGGQRVRTRWQGRMTAAVVVPAEAWADEADVVRGIDAPELAPAQLVDTARVAALLGITASTVRGYVHRGYLVPPTVEGFASPLWSVPQLIDGLRERAGRGRRRAAPPQVHTSQRSTPPPRRSLADIDAMIAALDARFGWRIDDDE